MEKHYALNDIAFGNAFLTGCFDPNIFSHEAHLRLAWIHIRKYGVVDAFKNVTVQLQQFVDLIGAKSKYNETVTIAAVKAVYHFMLKSQAVNFQSFISENPRLKYNFKELLSCHYTTDIFKSEQAKRTFLDRNYCLLMVSEMLTLLLLRYHTSNDSLCIRNVGK